MVQVLVYPRLASNASTVVSCNSVFDFLGTAYNLKDRRLLAGRGLVFVGGRCHPTGMVKVYTWYQFDRK